MIIFAGVAQLMSKYEMKHFLGVNDTFFCAYLSSFPIQYVSQFLSWLLGTSVLKLAACTSPIFLFFHFPLVKDIELLGEWRTDLPVFREYVGRCLANRANTPCVCPVRKASTSAVNRKTQDNSSPIMLLYRTHPRMKTLFSPYAARRQS